MAHKEYERWLVNATEDKDLIPELEGIAANEEEIRDRFALSLSFGTAGLRGIIGAGTNRMNIYTVRKATQGLACYLLSQTVKPSVAISFDSRIKSGLFSKEAARVLAANGIKVYIYPVLEPVPLLSFAVRHLKTDAGIMITASHNPAKYNGYKAYGRDGCQMASQAADSVMAAMDKLDIFTGIKLTAFDEALARGEIEYIGDDVLEAYYANVKQQALRPGLGAQAGFRLVYSPLNGAGNVPVRRILADIGISDVHVVPQQEMPDGNFPTCPYPNPEVRQTLSLGLELAAKIDADLMLATDPDADRVGIAVGDEAGQQHLLSGNEVGVLLLDYICRSRREMACMPQNPLFVKSIVTTPMAVAVGQKYGVECIDVLTGFKYIGEQILRLELAGQEQRFIFGFEESYGYLAGTYVRDKDAVVASMLICEMAAWYKTRGKNLYQAMQDLYAEFGYYLALIENYEFEGLSGMEKMKGIMQALRGECPKAIGGLRVLRRSDYMALTTLDMATGSEKSIGHLPQADIMAYDLDEGATVVVRPSGTEPKIKVYYTTRAEGREQAAVIQARLSAAVKPLLA